MHSYIIVGNKKDRDDDIQARLLSLHVSPVDVVTIRSSETSIGIKDVREFISTVQLSPTHSPVLAGLIPDASMLTIDAQQALLKTLEEPPPSTIIILGTSQHHALLPTILSRCECIVLKTTPENDSSSTINESVLNDILNASSGLRLSLLASPCKTKESSTTFLHDALTILRDKITKQSVTDTTQIITILKRLLHLYTVNHSSMNMQLLIESAFL